MKNQEHVFAVVRLDEYLGENTPFEHKVTVKEIVETQEIAEREVERLMHLNGGKGCRYFWQVTRFVPSSAKSGFETV